MIFGDYHVHFLKFWNLPRFTREISKFQKSELGKFIPYFPLKLVITNTNFLAYISHQQQKNCVYREEKFSCSENIIALTHFFQMLPFSTLPLMFWCFRGLEKGCIENKLFNLFLIKQTQTVAQRSIKKLLLKTSRNSQENTCARVCF